MIIENKQLLIPYKEYKREDLIDVSGIYCLYNVINDKVYIGQANNIGWRIQMHLDKIDDGLYFHNALKKYGYDNFRIYLLERFLFINKDEQNKSEIYFISKFKSNNPDFGYNLTEGSHLSEENPSIIYFYNIEHRFILTFESCVQAIRVLKSMGFNTNESSLSRCKLGTQMQTAGFIVGRSKKELLNRIENYTKETIQSTINYIKEYNLQDSQDTLNWMDDINKLSVEF